MSNLNNTLDEIRLQMFLPCIELKPYVQCYWRIYKDKELTVPLTNKIISEGGMGVVLNFGSAFSIAYDSEIYDGNDKCILTGPTQKATYLTASGKVNTIGIRFQPGGAYPFFQEEISSFTDKIIPMPANDEWQIEELYDSLISTKTINKKMSMLDTFLLKKLQQNTSVPSLWMSKVVGIVRKHNGSIKIDELGKQLNMTRRHFERKFKKEVGLLPKQFSRIIRIEKSRSLIRSLNFNSLTDVGYECDYFDQAHFVREFKTFVEETPKQYLKEKKRMSLLYNY